MRVLAACSLGGAGHLQPLVPFLDAASGNGDDVLVVAPPALAGMVAEAGVPFVEGGEPPEEVVAPIREQLPIAPARESCKKLEAAFDRIAKELEAGEVVCLFPEGKITEDGTMNLFRSGIEKIIERTPVPVVPMALKGMWGSFFSRHGGLPMRRPFRRFWSRVSLVIGEPMSPEEVSAKALQERVAKLGNLDSPVAVAPENVHALAGR